jgi:hypothetical protein
MVSEDDEVLLIEDSKFQRTANGRALIRAGYDVVYAADREEGLGEPSRSYFARYDVTETVRTRCPRALRANEFVKTHPCRRVEWSRARE